MRLPQRLRTLVLKNLKVCVLEPGLTDMQTATDLQELRASRSFSNELAQLSPQSRTASDLPAVGDVGSSFDLLRHQISGSLQQLRLAALPSGLPSSDPYRASSEHQAPLLIVEFGFQHVYRLEDFTRALDGFPTSSVATMPKTVASFVGRVESLAGDSANVFLMSEQTGERLESRCDSEVLRESGIGAGDDFRCEVIRFKGTTTTRFSRLAPKRLSKERVEQIRASFKDRWTF